MLPPSRIPQRVEAVDRRADQPEAAGAGEQLIRRVGVSSAQCCATDQPRGADSGGGAATHGSGKDQAGSVARLHAYTHGFNVLVSRV